MQATAQASHAGVMTPDSPRILLILSSLCAEGTPVLALDLCRRWIAAGIEPVVVTLSEEPADLAEEFARARVTVHPLIRSNSGYLRYAQMIAATRSLCRRLRPRAVLSMLFGWHAFLASGARLGGVRTVAAHVGNYPALQHAGSLSKFRLLVQAGRPITSKLICCSAYVQHGVVHRFGVRPCETQVIYNGVAVDTIASRAAAVRSHSERKPSRFVIGMVARLEIHKDQPTLIRAARLLCDLGHSIECWLVGEGSRRSEYEKLIAELGLVDSVKLLGMRRDVPELLGHLDAFVFAATPDEGQGVALVEAMAAGVPIVATDVGACREVLDDGELGTLIPPRDAGALAAALDHLRREPAAAKDRVVRARRKAVDTFSIDAMAASYARCLNLV